MKRFLIPAVVGLVVAAAAVAHGSLTGRWRPLPPLDGYTARLAAVPLAVGDWTGKDVPLPDADSLASAGIAGHLHRQYTHKSSGEVLSVLIVCGRHGPISVHTPDVCYASAGYQAVGSQNTETVELPGRRVTCSQLRFKPPAGRIDARDLDIRWTWCSDPAGVEAPTNPRVAFSSKPALFKLYVIRELPPARPPTAPAATPPAAVADPVEQFLEVFVPPMEEALRAAG